MLMVESQLRQAHNLIERGRIEEARKLLETLDDPTARQWLALLNARKRPPKRRNPLPLPLLVALGVVIGIGVIIVIVLLTPTLLARLQSQSGEAQTSTAAANDSLYAGLHQFCTLATGISNDSCLDWTDAVLRDHRAGAQSCLTASGVDTQEQRTQLAKCLANAGVPPPV
jgi:hypothetical protein